MLEEVRRDEGESMTLRLWHDCPGLCASTPLTFSWFIATAETLEPRIAPQLDGQVYVTGRSVYPMGYAMYELALWP